jgi:hypothetical protein
MRAEMELRFGYDFSRVRVRGHLMRPRPRR